MTTLAAFQLAVYLMAADGLIALAFTGLVTLPLTGVLAAAMTGSLWRGGLAGWLRVPSIGRVLAAGVAILSALDIFYLAASLLEGFLHLLLLLLVCRLYTFRSVRDGRDIAFLSFIMLVAAASAALDVVFLFIVIAFVMLAIVALMLLVTLAESERSPHPAGRGPARVEPALLVLALVASLATIAVTVVFFIVIPRVGEAVVPLRTRLGTALSGFTDRVELGAFGTIESDATVVMRVRFPEGPAAPSRLRDLRWRGMVFDHFDGRAWQVHRADRRRVPRAPTSEFVVGAPEGAGPILTQEIYLEPIGTDVIFAAPRLIALHIPTETITIDDMGSTTIAAPAGRLRYLARSELPTAPRLDRRRRYGRGELPPGDRYLQLPSVSSRIGHLARRITEGAAGDLDAATRLRDFLSRDYRYTLTLPPQTALDPLDEFLFVRRSGNCEYFAAALAVMLRSTGIPARVVNGFQRGEWNPYGEYLVVRQRDAHAWVEAHVQELGWITLDPSPRPELPGQTRSWPIGLYIDALRLQWYRYVINWSFEDQVALAAGMQRAASVAQQRAHGLGRSPELSGMVRVLTAVTILGVAAILLSRSRRRRGPHRSPATTCVPWFYGRALRGLRRHGLRPEAAETSREFLARVGQALPPAHAPLARLTAAYERARFSAASLDPDESWALEDDLAALRSCSRRPEVRMTKRENRLGERAPH
jgi:transglutaminase-like putative cysteine protease